MKKKHIINDKGQKACRREFWKQEEVERVELFFPDEYYSGDYTKICKRCAEALDKPWFPQDIMDKVYGWTD